MKEVIFKNLGGRNVPVLPWPQKFYISGVALYGRDVYELRPLTATGIIKGIAMNFLTMNIWRMYRLFYRAGFLDTPESGIISFRDWRWIFWRTLKKRKAHKA